jgi:hypothetical protein
MPAITLNNSPEKCEPLPTPAEPNANPSGFSRASGIKPAISLTPTEGCTTTRIGTVANSETGTRALNRSQRTSGASACLLPSANGA